VNDFFLHFTEVGLLAAVFLGGTRVMDYSALAPLSRILSRLTVGYGGGSKFFPTIQMLDIRPKYLLGSFITVVLVVSFVHL
jgi:hypothetical protein